MWTKLGNRLHPHLIERFCGLLEICHVTKKQATSGFILKASTD